MKQLDVSVYQTTTELIITGQPTGSHHCDSMGCQSEHVLYRFRLPSVTLDSSDEVSLQESTLLGVRLALSVCHQLVPDGLRFDALQYLYRFGNWRNLPLLPGDQAILSKWAEDEHEDK